MRAAPGRGGVAADDPRDVDVDVDLDAGTVLVAETRFFKSRWVPVSASLAAELATYLAARTAAVGGAGPDDPFFINSRVTRCSYSRIWRLFRRLVRDAGIDASATRRGRVRLHHLRQTFATHCVLRSYREGSDVGARLPLLATYLGHASVLATHVYLAASPELLGAASEQRHELQVATVAADTLCCIELGDEAIVVEPGHHSFEITRVLGVGGHRRRPGHLQGIAESPQEQGSPPAPCRLLAMR